MKEYEYDISLHCAAVRPEMWMRIYKTFMKNKMSVEAVFVGDKYPSYKLPSNFNFIYSEVKPSQCFEIAARNCKGKYIAQTSDDYFYPDGYFDNMVSFHKKQVKKFSTDKIITGGVHHTRHNKARERQCRLWTRNAQPKQELPMDFFLTSDFYRELGGLDRNFISLVHHWDIMMRVMEMGGKCIMSDLPFWERHNEKSNHVYLSSVTGRIDKKYFHELWWCPWNIKYKNKKELEKSGDSYYVTNGRGYLPVNRQKKLELFEDKDILTVTQGRSCGRWKKKDNE